MSQFSDHYRRGLGMSTHNNALAYGYPVTVTASFGVLTQTAKPVSIGRIFLFVVGASVAFAAVNAAVTRGFRTRVQTEPPVVLALATSLGVLSIIAGARGGARPGMLMAASGHLLGRAPRGLPRVLRGGKGLPAGRSK